MVLKTVLYHMFSMFFHPSYGLSFIPLNMSFEEQEWQSKLLCSSFMDCTVSICVYATSIFSTAFFLEVL